MSVTSRLRKTHMSEQAGKIIEVFKKKFFLFIVIAQKKRGKGHVILGCLFFDGE